MIKELMGYMKFGGLETITIKEAMRFRSELLRDYH